MPQTPGEKILVYGCGDLAWGRKMSSRFGGSDWEPGGLPEPMPLDPQAGEGTALAASLTDELDGEVGWSASRTPGEVKVTARPGSGAGELLLPSWEELVARQVREITRMLDGSGVLVTPEGWCGSKRGRSFLRAWAQEDWRWAPLEEVLRARFSAGARFVSAGRSWLRICEPAGSAVVANGAEAACALTLAPKILAQTLAQASETLAMEWRLLEEPKTGWFLRQQIGHAAAAAYCDGRGSFELGPPGMPLFLFSTKQARKQFRELAELHLTVELPAMPYASWWEQIASPDFLPAPAGSHRRPALRWDDLETVFLAHPDSANRSSRAEIRSLYDYLRFNGRPHRLVDPAMLKEALGMGIEIEPWLAKREKDERPPAASTPAVAMVSAAAVAPEPEPEPAEGRAGELALALPSPAPDAESPAETTLEPVIEEVMLVAPDPLLGFRPDAFFLGEGHELGRLAIWLDGEPVAPERLKGVELAPGQRGFRLEGVRVGHGAIVRVDFEPVAVLPGSLDGLAGATSEVGER